MSVKYTRKALPGQLPLFTPDMEPPKPAHDPTGMLHADIAAWVLTHGAGRLTRPERVFLFGITLARPLALPDLARLSALHARVGGRAILGANV